MALTLRPGEPLAVYLRAMGMTVTELAERTGIRRQRLSEICNGRRDPVVWQRHAIAAALDVPADQLFD